MNKLILVFIYVISAQIFAQSKEEYLKENRFDLRSEQFHFPESSFKIIGFGAYHGSAKTEAAEEALLYDLVKENKVNYYLPETDFSTAYYFNRYLENGDVSLLKDLVYFYGCRVPQERSVEVYEKWKRLKLFNDTQSKDNKLQVVGIDEIANYKYSIKHILEQLDVQEAILPSVKGLREINGKTTIDFSAYYESEAMICLKAFVNAYEENTMEFNKHIKDKQVFSHIIDNVKRTFDPKNQREEAVYLNYKTLSKWYNFDSKPQFARFGFSHLEKSREGKTGYPYFFTRLIENGDYKRNEVISIIGYLTNSRVFWEERYTKNNQYKGYTTKGGYGIGDYWKEYFRGIKALKQTKISDLTLFRLNKENSPYYEKVPDLIEVKMVFSKSNKERLIGCSTLDFIDYGILISDSKANNPIQEMK